jgi:hypothetical protein
MERKDIPLHSIVDPEVANRLFQEDIRYAPYIHPSILSDEMIHKVLVGKYQYVRLGIKPKGKHFITNDEEAWNLLQADFENVYFINPDILPEDIIVEILSSEVERAKLYLKIPKFKGFIKNPETVVTLLQKSFENVYFIDPAALTEDIIVTILSSEVEKAKDYLMIPELKGCIKNPELVAHLLQADRDNIYFIDQTILSEDAVSYVLDGSESAILCLKPTLNPELYKRMMPRFMQDPTIFEKIDLTPLLTEEEIITLGFKQPKAGLFERLKAAIGNDTKIYLHALCHGGILSIITPDIKIKRYSSVPLGVCEFFSVPEEIKMHNETRFETFEESTEETIMRIQKMVRGEGESSQKRVEALKIAKPIKKEYLPSTGTDIIMDKLFSTKGEKVAFLDVVTRDGPFNLFSFCEKWRIQQKTFTPGSIPGIIEFLKHMLGRDNFEIVIGDYSCSATEAIDPSILSRAGKRMQKRTRYQRNLRTKRKRRSTCKR